MWPGHTFKISTYTITSNDEDVDNGLHYSSEITELLQKTYTQVKKKKKQLLPQLLKLIEKYPNVPAFKNYLSTCYKLNNNQEKAQEVNHWIVKEHPDYLYGKLNLAAEFLLKEQYDEIPKILGEALDIKELYPDRKVFHIQEYLAFLNVSCRYFILTDQLEEAERRLEPAETIVKEHPIINDLKMYIRERRMDNFNKRLEELLEERGEKTLGESYDVTIQTDEPPVFLHPEIQALYENGLGIDHAILKNILALPRKSLLEDLEKVLWDSVRRFEFFREFVKKNGGWDEEKMNFPLHALFLMTELKATEELPFILNYFKQGEQVLEFWFDDHTTETLWHFIYHLGADQLDLLLEFMQEPYLHYGSRWIVTSGVNQLALHHPERRQEFLDWYAELLDFFLLNPDDPKVVDPDVNGSLVAELVDIQAKELLPEIKKLFDLDLVDLTMAGDYEAVEKEMMKPDSTDRQKFPIHDHIFDHYEAILESWFSYMPAEERKKEEEQPVKTWSEMKLEEAAQKPPKIKEPEPFRPIPIGSKAAKVGRNEPCPCGSGKKYKHCCGKS